MIHFRNRPVPSYSTAELLAIQTSTERLVRPLRVWREVAEAIEAELLKRALVRRAERRAA